MAHNEQVFTPKYIVEDILDRVGYKIELNNIRKKHIIDNSCGNGAFLCEIVSRYIDACIYDNVDVKEIVNEVETYIHGIEIDKTLCEETQRNLMNICKAKEIKLPHIVFFDIRCKDALTCDEFNNKMDFVVGNPPYCKVHDLKDKYNKVKKYNFAQGGMTDLYLVFFEIGINMLNNTGKLGYITPNSWMTSKAGLNFRNWIKETNKLSEIVQFGGIKIFDKVTTFTNIITIDNSKNNNLFDYVYGIDDTENRTGNLSFSFIDSNFYLGNRYELETLNKIINNISYHKIKVKNGFATLNDKLFIMHNDWKKMCDFGKNLIPIWKASKDKLLTAIYPYDKDGKTISYDELDIVPKEILKIQSEILGIDKSQENWYLYGRYQGIKDMPKYRIGINNLICNGIWSINIKLLEPYIGIYSGLYLVCEDDEHFIENNYKKIYDILANQDFINYVKSLGKYKNGGYYTFSSKDLENYINYMFFK